MVSCHQFQSFHTNLLQAGLLDQVEAVLNGLSEPAKSNVKIEWEFATICVRNWSLLISVAAAIGLTNEQIDALFDSASVL